MLEYNTYTIKQEDGTEKEINFAIQSEEVTKLEKGDILAVLRPTREGHYMPLGIDASKIGGGGNVKLVTKSITQSITISVPVNTSASDYLNTKINDDILLNPKHTNFRLTINYSNNVFVVDLLKYAKNPTEDRFFGQSICCADSPRKKYGLLTFSISKFSDGRWKIYLWNYGPDNILDYFSIGNFYYDEIVVE